MSISWLGWGRREGLWVLLDHLLDVLSEANNDLLIDVDVEIDLDWFVGSLHCNAAGERARGGS